MDYWNTILYARSWTTLEDETNTGRITDYSDGININQCELTCTSPSLIQNIGKLFVPFYTESTSTILNGNYSYNSQLYDCQ